MSLYFCVDGKSEIERFILILNMGIINSLEKDLITFEEAENYFYSPYTADKLEELGVDKKIIDLIYHGCELDDVNILVPEKLNDSLKDVKNKTIKLLKKIPKSDLPTKYWIE